MKVLLVFLMWTFVRCALAIKFPADVPRCKKGDSQCIINSANIMMKTYANGGNRNINLLSLDPLQVPLIHIQQGEESPVNVELIFTNNTINGLRNIQFTKIEGFNEKVEGKYELRLTGPRLEMIGPYSIKGKILVLPIQGVGISNITVLGPDFKIIYYGKSVTKNGKIHLSPENTKLSFTVTRMYLHLSNLYKGDKALGDNTNLFLNENWQEVFQEIKKSVFAAYGQIIHHILKSICEKIPYDEFFISQ